MFNNGNKRTALLTALTFLNLNGYILDFEQMEELAKNLEKTSKR